jgi:hypothetical protein
MGKIKSDKVETVNQLTNLTVKEKAFQSTIASERVF